MLSVVVNNIDRKEEIDFKERVRVTMVKQIKKKFLAEGRKTIKHSCDAPFIVHHNIEQIKETV